MMKAKPYLLAVLACVFMGCEMAEVVDWGSDCPTDDSKSLTYIGKSTCTKDNASECQLDGKTYDFSTNFDIRRCPKEFSVCAVNEDDSNYHCEKDTKKGCADTQITCPRNDGTDDVDCIDPSSTKTCGATDCKSINYGGKDCSEYGELSRCQFSNDTEKYVCRCPSGALLCGTQCIDPNDPKFCGASDCDAENYGGIDCEKGDAYCASGKCTCSAGSIWCSVNGEPEKCVSPRENATCNAHLSEDGSTCEITPCDDNQACTRNGDEYSCSQYKCDDDQQLCNADDGCISKLDDDNCGVCNNKCSELLQSNAHGSECTQTEEGKYACAYECNEGFENCGSATEPNCVALNTFQHCGSCDKTCNDNEACDPEMRECIPTGCAPNECPLPGKDGEEAVCVMDDEHCGSNCQICSNVHENAACLNGTCVVSECNDGEHPVFEETLIIRCDSNTVTSCAPKDIKVSDEPVDCTETLANAHEVKCSEEGKCAAVSCEPGFHLNKDNSACLANTSTLCGSGDSSEVVNCDEEIADAVETECVSNVCFAKKCAEGFHLSSDLKMCEANDTSKCAPVDSSDAKDCSTVPKATQSECVNGFCKAKLCMSDNHLSQDKSECVANSNELCGAIDSNTTVDCTALANADTAVCESGSCFVNKCKENYHISKDNKSCVTNTNTSCASPASTKEENCQTINNASSTDCDKGSCIVLECKSGFHVSQDKKSCVSNESTKCAPPNGGQEVNCNDAIIDSAQTTCNAGVCEVVECAVDHHPSSDKKSCIKNTATACASTTSSATVNCNNKILNSATTTCNKGICNVTKCAANHHITNSDATSCTANSDTSCAATTSSSPVNCNTTISNSATTACNSSGACTVSNCKSGFHLNSGKTACVETTAAACAATNSSTTINCNSTIQNSATTSCSNGTCYVSKCASGFHLNSSKTACDGNSNSSCAPTNSNSPVNCSSTIANSVTTACSSSGTCTVSKCKDTYHLNSGKTGCDANSQTSCAPTTSNSPTNCTSIANAVTTACSSSGTCTVSKCKDTYHLNSGKTGCEANSNTSCAATTSNSPTNCTSIANAVSTACSSSGSCTVSKCKTNYHLNSGKTGCDANSNTSCAATTSNSPVNCTSGVAKYCVSGACKCSTDGSSVLNWNNSACVHKACLGIPGVMAGSVVLKNFYNNTVDDYACFATSCATNFSLYSQGNGSYKGSMCHPTAGHCNGMGYSNTSTCDGTYGHNRCTSGYRYYVLACLPKDYCCGTRDVNMNSAKDYLCKNCVALGKTCNMSTGNCE